MGTQVTASWYPPLRMSWALLLASMFLSGVRVGMGLLLWHVTRAGAHLGCGSDCLCPCNLPRTSVTANWSGWWWKMVYPGPLKRQVGTYLQLWGRQGPAWVIQAICCWCIEKESKISWKSPRAIYQAEIWKWLRFQMTFCVWSASYNYRAGFLQRSQGERKKGTSHC